VNQRKKKQKLDEEVKRLRADGRKRQQLHEDRADPNASDSMEQNPAKQAKLVDKSAVVTVKWKKKHGKLPEDKIRGTFDGFGEIEAIIIKEDKAVINFRSSSSARAAFFSHGDSMDETLGIKVKLFWSNGSGDGPEIETTKTEVPSKWSEPVAAATAPIEADGAADDYENITMMNMRRAAERQRLIAEMEAEDE